MRNITISPVITPEIMAADRAYRETDPMRHNIMRNCAFVRAILAELPETEAVSISGHGLGDVVTVTSREQYQGGGADAVTAWTGTFQLPEDALKKLNILDSNRDITLPYQFTITIRYS